MAADAQVTALGQIDPYYVYVPGGGGVLLVKEPHRRRDDGVGHPRRRESDRPGARCQPCSRWRRTSGGRAAFPATVTALFAGLGVLALVLASVGIYGVVSYAVTGRYREIGVRMALGATARNVLGLILRQTMRPVVVGAVIGRRGGERPCRACCRASCSG